MLLHTQNKEVWLVPIWLVTVHSCSESMSLVTHLNLPVFLIAKLLWFLKGNYYLMAFCTVCKLAETLLVLFHLLYVPIKKSKE